ncbi:MAG: winged helix-turn-helix transcriptional regulator [Candidatus Thorarchaeota archaeon]|nr:winged helix-turn-helix transcriptional regulator [Candidatus Thorarchaeota archaeon]
MDPLDWALICELCGNARMSYQVLARKLSISPNTVKHRINRLHKQKVIVGFGVLVSMEMLGAEDVLGVIVTDGTEKAMEFIKQIIARWPIVNCCYRTSDRRYEYWARVSGASETLGLKMYLEGLNGVTDVEMRPVVYLSPNMPPNSIMNTRGKKVVFTQHQLQVLRCLYQDARLPVSQIAQQTGFTHRRVRKILRELEEGGGIHFVVGFDAFALGDMEYRLKICYDDAQTTGPDIIMALYEKYPEAFWWATITTNQPIIDVGLLIDRPGKGMPIIQDLKESPFIKSIEDFVSYPRVIGNISPLRRRLEEILIEAGLLTEPEIIRKTPILIDAKPQDSAKNGL